MRRKLLSILALLCLTVASAWADSFSTTPYSSNATLSSVTVSSDMTITINSGVTVTVNSGLNVSSGTLTVVGGGTLTVNGAGSGGIAVKGNIIVQGATVKAYGGQGSTGSTGSQGSAGGGNKDGGTGGQGDTGGTGGAAFSGAVVIYSGQIVAQGGKGGTGGTGGRGGDNPSSAWYDAGNGGRGGNGGTGGAAFTSTLTVYGGNVDAIGGDAGSGGSGGAGGTGYNANHNGSSGSGGGSGSAGSAFSNASNLTLINTTDSKMYSNAGHTTEVITATGKTIYITAPDYIPSLTLSEATDNATWISNHAGLVYNITLTRTLQTGGWNTFSVPFSIDKPSGWTVKELTDASYDSGTKTLSLTFGDAASIVAGHAYMVQVESAVVNPTFNDVTIVNDPTPTTISGVVEFVPAINPVSMTADDKTTLFVAGGNSLTYPNTDGYMNGFRAYFHLLGDAAASAASVKSYNMHFGDEDMTGIEKIEDAGLKSENLNDAIFDLSGRRVQNPTKGIYIKNGRKVVIK